MNENPNPIKVPPPAPSSVSQRVHLYYSPPPSPQPQQPRGNLSPKAVLAPQVAESDEVMDDFTSGNQEELDEPPRAVSPLYNVDSSSTSSNTGVEPKQLAAGERAATRRRRVA
ncbi:hypothetical protein CRE_19971 [Caenorhabditis remanei]|uniref:Uncharacterized protein n=1 Tax=Caenorhabditis remanei TaxID=31234 RepID=E3N8F9_CAERE|nr:hypothetical protein CRE_19971 [Caenorhabditis remanei]